MKIQGQPDTESQQIAYVTHYVGRLVCLAAKQSIHAEYHIVFVMMSSSDVELYQFFSFGVYKHLLL